MARAVMKLGPLLGTLALGACFASGEPLITTRDAAYPFGVHTSYTHYTLQGDAQKSWVKKGTGEVVLGDDRVYADTEGSGKDASVTHFLMSAMGNGYYAVADITDDEETYYDLLKLEGDTVYVYGLDCADLTDAARREKGIGAPDEDGFCNVPTLDSLTGALRLYIAANVPPTDKYVIER